MGLTLSSMYMIVFANLATAFWDIGTTTAANIRTDDQPRQSFFRWQWTESNKLSFWLPSYDWDEIARRKRLFVIAGISIDFIPLGTAVLLNRRVLITSANYLEPYQNRQRDLRIWALGRDGKHHTPYRYRVWRTRRLFPRSDNPEHWHGVRGVHVPRHDIAVIHSFDQIYLYGSPPNSHQFAYRAPLTGKHTPLGNDIWFAGSGYEYMEHVMENYKIFYASNTKEDIVDCSRYLPKWWGKFICLRNTLGFAGVPNGGGLFHGTTLVGIGCFEIRYNEVRIMAFTDLRYYVDYINTYANITRGEYYEYAYPEWFVNVGAITDGGGSVQYIPLWKIHDDLFPLGR